MVTPRITLMISVAAEAFSNSPVMEFSVRLRLGGRANSLGIITCPAIRIAFPAKPIRSCDMVL